MHLGPGATATGTGRSDPERAAARVALAERERLARELAVEVPAAPIGSVEEIAPETLPREQAFEVRSLAVGQLRQSVDDDGDRAVAERDEVGRVEGALGILRQARRVDGSVEMLQARIAIAAARHAMTAKAYRRCSLHPYARWYRSRR